MSLQEDTGRRIRQLRKAKGLTQEQLAGKAGLDAKYYGSLERGERNATLTSLEKVASALGVEPLQLFLFTAPGEVKAEKIAEAKILDALRRSDARTGQGLLRILREVLALVER